jgi:hypothetical protein
MWSNKSQSFKSKYLTVRIGDAILNNLRVIKWSACAKTRMKGLENVKRLSFLLGGEGI